MNKQNFQKDKIFHKVFMMTINFDLCYTLKRYKVKFMALIGQNGFFKRVTYTIDRK